MMQAQAAPSAIGSALLTFAALALTIFAILRCPRKWDTALYIIGCMIIGCLLGALVGLAFYSPKGAGALTGFGTQVAGIVAAFERIRRYRKTAPLRK
jgi:drug/metabolite transporter (DMT)-like permease